MINITKEKLYKLYITDNLTLIDISNKYNISYSHAKSLVKKYQIKKSRKDIAKTTCERNMKKYGVRSAMQRKEVQEKSKKTLLEHYGVDNPMKSKTLQNKAINTNLEKYGVKYTCQNAEVRAKMEHTNLEKYGSISPFGNSKVQEKSDKTKMAKYGTIKNSDNPIYAKYFLNEKTAYDFIKNNYQNYTISNLSKELNYSESNMGLLIRKYNLSNLLKIYSNTSSYEDEIENLLKSWGITNIIRNHKFKELNNLEIDIYLPDFQIGIEFNGNYWHCEDKKDKKYHQKKSLLAEKNNIFIYHIFEYEWNDSNIKLKIINQLKNLTHKNENKIYARKCQIREVSSKDKSKFLNKNHLQGNDKSNINLGLFYNDELVSLMTFTKARFSKKYDWELSRFCSKSNTNVIGGANKLFKYFKNNYLNNNNIITYSDISKTKGSLYLVLGFSLDHISLPNYVWWNSSNIKTRYQCQMKNENTKMHDLGYKKIYDSGNKVWTFKQ